MVDNLLEPVHAIKPSERDDSNPPHGDEMAYTTAWLSTFQPGITSLAEARLSPSNWAVGDFSFFPASTPMSAQPADHRARRTDYTDGPVGSAWQDEGADEPRDSARSSHHREGLQHAGLPEEALGGMEEDMLNILGSLAGTMPLEPERRASGTEHDEPHHDHSGPRRSEAPMHLPRLGTPPVSDPPMAGRWHPSALPKSQHPHPQSPTPPLPPRPPSPGAGMGSWSERASLMGGLGSAMGNRHWPPQSASPILGSPPSYVSARPGGTPSYHPHSISPTESHMHLGDDGTPRFSYAGGLGYAFPLGSPPPSYAGTPREWGGGRDVYNQQGHPPKHEYGSDEDNESQDGEEEEEDEGQHQYNAYNVKDTKVYTPALPGFRHHPGESEYGYSPPFSSPHEPERHAPNKRKPGVVFQTGQQPYSFGASSTSSKRASDGKGGRVLKRRGAVDRTRHPSTSSTGSTSSSGDAKTPQPHRSYSGTQMLRPAHRPGKGSYRCGKCGQPKANHKCPYADDLLDVRCTNSQTDPRITGGIPFREMSGRHAVAEDMYVPGDQILCARRVPINQDVDLGQVKEERMSDRPSRSRPVAPMR